MFVRKKTNRSGTISIVVVSKANGKFIEVKKFGVAKSEEEAADIYSEGGYPLSYSIFNGSQYEGFTMIPMIDDFKQRYDIGENFVVVADSGLMNKNNVTLLRQAGYKYILGARIKNESTAIKQWILSLNTGIRMANVS